MGDQTSGSWGVKQKTEEHLAAVAGDHHFRVGVQLGGQNAELSNKPLWPLLRKIGKLYEAKWWENRTFSKIQRLEKKCAGEVLEPNEILAGDV